MLDCKFCTTFYIFLLRIFSKHNINFSCISGCHICQALGLRRCVQIQDLRDSSVFLLLTARVSNLSNFDTCFFYFS